MSEDFDPATHVMGANGPVPIRIVPATLTAVGLHDGSPRSGFATAMEAAMVQAVKDSQGEPPDVVKARILMARDKIAGNV